MIIIINHLNHRLSLVTYQAGENNENRRLSGSEAVDHYSWLFWVRESANIIVILGKHPVDDSDDDDDVFANISDGGDGVFLQRSL